jgi:S1-C subfamily serine protease
VLPSTVLIENLVTSEPGEGESCELKLKGCGSGFIWDTEGHIVTNHHVVAGASAISLKFSDQSQYNGEIVAQSPWSDIAVIKVKAPKDRLIACHRGDSDRLRIGQTVLALGSPYALAGSLSRGIFSALGRELPGVSGRPIRGLIQTDAAVHPGNSGGPLITLSQHVVGMVSMTYGNDKGGGLGFAIPIAWIERVVENIVHRR